MKRSPRQIRYGVGLLLAILMGILLMNFYSEDSKAGLTTTQHAQSENGTRESR